MHVYLCRLYAIIKIQNLTWKVFFMIQFKYEDIYTTSVYTTLYYQCCQKYYLVYIYYFFNLLAKFVKVLQFYSVIFICTCTYTCEAYWLQTLMNTSIPDIPSINPLYLTNCVYYTLKIPNQQKNTNKFQKRFLYVSPNYNTDNFYCNSVIFMSMLCSIQDTFLCILSRIYIV